MTAQRPHLVRSPGRVNLIGDHTDYTGGWAFPIAIDRYTEIAFSPSDRIRLTSASEDEIVDLGLDGTGEVQGWGRYVAAVVREMEVVEGIDGEVSTTIPVGAGLSSSASLELAVAVSLGFEGSTPDLARLGQRAENTATGVPTGLLDQLCIATALEGHASKISFAGEPVVEHSRVPDDVAITVAFVAHRTLEGSGYAERVAQCQAAEALIGPLHAASLVAVGTIDDPVIAARARHVVSENARVHEFAEALAAGDLARAGQLMNVSHNSLRGDYACSTTEMDAAVLGWQTTPGVYGARMTGGGFGGCAVAIHDPDVELDGWRVRAVGAPQRVR